MPATPSAFDSSLKANQGFFANDLAEFGKVPHAAFSKPAALSFLPDWLFAYNYPNNVNKVGVPLAGCTEQHCAELPVPAFPTPLYETIACFLLFALLWGLRKRLKPVGSLFALYLIVNGLERFFIEKIRVNNRLDIFGIHPTQAEVISLGLVLTGIILWIFLLKKYHTRPI